MKSTAAVLMVGLFATFSAYGCGQYVNDDKKWKECMSSAIEDLSINSTLSSQIANRARTEAIDARHVAESAVSVAAGAQTTSEKAHVVSNEANKKSDEAIVIANSAGKTATEARVIAVGASNKVNSIVFECVEGNTITGGPGDWTGYSTCNPGFSPVGFQRLNMLDATHTLPQYDVNDIQCNSEGCRAWCHGVKCELASRCCRVVFR